EVLVLLREQQNCEAPENRKNGSMARRRNAGVLCGRQAAATQPTACFGRFCGKASLCALREMRGAVLPPPHTGRMVFSMAYTPKLTYKGRPLVRCGNDIYYGSLKEPYVVYLQVLTTKKEKGVDVA